MPEGGEQKRKKGKKSYHMKENRIEPKDIYSHFSVSFTLIDDFSLHYNLKDVNVSIFFYFFYFFFPKLNYFHHLFWDICTYFIRAHR